MSQRTPLLLLIVMSFFCYSLTSATTPSYSCGQSVDVCVEGNEVCQIRACQYAPICVGDYLPEKVGVGIVGSDLCPEPPTWVYVVEEMSPEYALQAGPLVVTISGYFICTQTDPWREEPATLTVTVQVDPFIRLGSATAVGGPRKNLTGRTLNLETHTYQYCGNNGISGEYYPPSEQDTGSVNHAYQLGYTYVPAALDDCDAEATSTWMGVATMYYYVEYYLVDGSVLVTPQAVARAAAYSKMGEQTEQIIGGIVTNTDDTTYLNFSIKSIPIEFPIPSGGQKKIATRMMGCLTMFRCIPAVDRVGLILSTLWRRVLASMLSSGIYENAPIQMVLAGGAKHREKHGST